MAAAATMFSMPAMAEMHGDKHDDKHDKHHEEKMEKKIGYYFEMMDENGDSSISQEEHDTFANNMFEETDTDGNDMISMDELKTQKMEEYKKMKEELWGEKKDWDEKKETM
jgi:hypothetical protein